MKNSTQNYKFLLLLIFFTSCKEQNRTAQPKNVKNKIEREFKNIPTHTKMDTLWSNPAPKNITRTIIQDKKGTIWFATFKGLFKYDGNSFTAIKEINPGRFFAALEDRKGNLWFGTVGSGVYRYDGKSFKNFNTTDGLLNNEVVSIYEDKSGTIWFGVNGGLSRYDGKSFRNYIINGATISEDVTGKYVPNFQRPMNEVNTIIEDKTGRFWLGTRGNTFMYDGNTFTTVTQYSMPFTNVRSTIEDKKGNIWLGGNDGLWRYNGIDFTNITKNFVGYIYEDKKGNIWTSSETTKGWALSRYNTSSSTNENKTVSEIKTGEGMFFGILEDSDGNIWSGTLNGAYRYDGRTLSVFKKKEDVY